MIDVFNQIFGADMSHIFQDKEAMKREAIQSYITGKITKKQLDEKMRELA